MLADRVTLAMDDNHARVILAVIQPLAVQAVEVTCIGAVQDTTFLRRKRELSFVVPAGETCFHDCQNVNGSNSKRGEYTSRGQE